MNKKNLHWIIFLIVLFEVLFLFYSKPSFVNEQIESVSFFVISNEKQTVEEYKQKVLQQSLDDNIKILLTRESEQPIIQFIVVSDSDKTDKLLKSLVSNPTPKSSLASYNSTTFINYKLVYILILLFIFIPVFLIWFTLVKPKENKFSTICTKKLLKYIVTLLLLSYLISYAVEIIFNIKIEPNPQNLNKFIQAEPLVSFLFMVIIAPIVEELLFRGLLFRIFIEKKLLILGVTFINIDFIFAHFAYFQLDTAYSTKILLGLGMFVISSSLCWVYYKFNNILAPIALHATNNLIAFLLISFNIL